MQTLTGTNTTDPTATPQASCVVDGDTGNAANLAVTPLLAILNAIGWIRSKMALLNMAGGVITNLGNGVANGDSVNMGQLNGKARAWSTTLSVTGTTLTGPTMVQLYTAAAPAGAQNGDACVVTQLSGGASVFEIILTANIAGGILTVAALLPFSGGVTFSTQNIIVIGFR